MQCILGSSSWFLPIFSLMILWFYLCFSNELRSINRVVIFCRVARLVRVFRIFKLSRYSLGLKMLGNTLRASMNELGMLVIFVVLSIIVFASGIYHFEHDTNGEKFDSIPSAFWYVCTIILIFSYFFRDSSYYIFLFSCIICLVDGYIQINSVH